MSLFLAYRAIGAPFLPPQSTRPGGAYTITDEASVNSEVVLAARLMPGLVLLLEAPCVNSARTDLPPHGGVCGSLS